jgi:hypothetical protein
MTSRVLSMTVATLLLAGCGTMPAPHQGASRTAAMQASGVTIDSTWLERSAQRAYAKLEGDTYAYLYEEPKLVSIECRRLDHTGRLVDASVAVFRFWAVQGETYPLVQITQAMDGRQTVDDTPTNIKERPVLNIRKLEIEGLIPPTELVPEAIAQGIPLAPGGEEATRFKVIYNGLYKDRNRPDEDIAHVISFHQGRIIGRMDLDAR